MTHIMAREIIDNDGDCSRHEAVLLAKAWLAAHPETPAKPVDPRRYEIAQGIYHVFIKDEDNGIYNDPSESAAYALMYTDALIAELDKEAAK